MTMASLTSLFGWSAVINIGVLFISTLMIMTMRKAIVGIHAALFKLDEQYLHKAYFQYIAQYKILIIALNIAPYFALKIIA